ncbi:hypothetical protein HMPREF0290_1430 [Corynebacterium efficiens YS-314]|nr:hypothetical protein HMPREF0290_1430 [Corynebacterium efficiens YS-314]
MGGGALPVVVSVTVAMEVSADVVAEVSPVVTEVAVSWVWVVSAASVTALEPSSLTQELSVSARVAADNAATILCGVFRITFMA